MFFVGVFEIVLYFFENVCFFVVSFFFKQGVRLELFFSEFWDLLEFDVFLLDECFFF